MNRAPYVFTRRHFVSRVAAGASLFAVPGAFADELMRTPPQGEGPFYPDKLPLDTDNDLLILNDSITPAVGEITHLSGRVMTTSGEPIRHPWIGAGFRNFSEGHYSSSGRMN